MDLLTLAQINKLKANGGVGYSSYETVELLSEQTATTDMYANSCPNVGDEITVYLNGVAYTQVAKYFDLDGTTIAYIGNAGELGGDATEDDFVVGFAIFEGMYVAMAQFYGELANAESITISATSKRVVAHPIDKAYVPFWDIKTVETDGVISFFANGKRIDFDMANQIAKSGIPSAITSHTINGNLTNCYIPCGFHSYADEVWMAFISPIAGTIQKHLFTAGG